MRNLVIFLNELSFASSLLPEGMLPHVLTTLATVRAAKRMRSDIVVAGQSSLGGVLLGDGTHSFASLLRGDTHKEEWRFLRLLEQSSPLGAHPNLATPGVFQEMICNKQAAVGMLWAKQNESAILSFAFSSDWEESQISGQFNEMDGDGNINAANVAIPNLSNPVHVTVHTKLINDYGHSISPSSLIYEGDGFVVRIWFNDHDPPHFHVLLRRDTSETLARCAIKTLDILSGSLSPVLRKKVREWAERRQGDLMVAWARCRSGEHPILLED